MKKILLLAAGAMVFTAAQAEDITPKGYNFPLATGLNISNFHNATAHITWDEVKGAEAWNDGLIGISGAQMGNAAVATAIKEGIQLVDLGGEIGQVLCINGYNSNAQNIFNTTYSSNIALKTIDNSWCGWFNLNFFFHPDMVPLQENNSLRITMVYNVYKNETMAGNVGNQIYTITSSNNVVPEGDKRANYPLVADNFQKMIEIGGVEIPDQGDDGNPIWDASKWCEMTWDTYLPDADGAPLKLKLEIKPGELNNSAIFIRSIKLETIPAASEEYTAERKISYLSLNPKGTDGIADAIAEADFNLNGNEATFNAAATVYNLCGQKVATAAAGETIALPRGLYIANCGARSSKLIVK